MTNCLSVAATLGMLLCGAAVVAEEALPDAPAPDDEASTAAEPQTGAVGLPFARVGPLTLQPTLGAGVAYFTQRNSWYGHSTANLGRNSDRWWEGYLTPGLGATLDLEAAGRLTGHVSVVGALTNGVDAAGSDVDDDTPRDTALDEAWLSWNSGPLFGETLGDDAVELSAGRQPFELGTGFLIWQGATNGGSRGAYWLAPRDAYELAGIARIESHGLIGRAFYLEPDDNPDTETRLAGIDLEYGFGEDGCAADAAPTSCLAAGYYKVVDSDIDQRDGMNVFDLRGDFRPLPAVPGVRVAGEFAYETNGSKLDAYGWYGELGYAADELPWSPYLGYRYAFFSGDDDNSDRRSEAFDPLFYDGPDWGIWNQGEILGEWVLSNSNLISHTVRLNAYPTDKLTVTALYYYFRLDDPGAAGVDDHDFAQEVNLIADYAVNGNLSVGAVAATSFPGDAAEQYTGGDRVWSQLTLYATLSF